MSDDSSFIEDIEIRLEKLASCTRKLELSESELRREFPPRFGDEKKAFVYNALLEKLGETELPVSQPLILTKWKPQKPKEGETERAWPLMIVEKNDIYRYNSTNKWYVNFAGRFFAGTYDGPFYGVDEIQCLEFPVLCSINERLSKRGDFHTFMGCLQDIDTGEGSPMLLENVVRRIEGVQNLKSIDPQSLSLETLRNSGVNFLEREQHFGLIFMEAPTEARPYKKEVVERAYRTAYSAFRACVLTDSSKSRKTTINTGHWGCGAYKGEIKVMAMIQLRAANDAGVDKIVYHTVDGQGSMGFKAAVSTIEKHLLFKRPLECLVDYIVGTY